MRRHLRSGDFKGSVFVEFDSEELAKEVRQGSTAQSPCLDSQISKAAQRAALVRLTGDAAGAGIRWRDPADGTPCGVRAAETGRAARAAQLAPHASGCWYAARFVVCTPRSALHAACSACMCAAVTEQRYQGAYAKPPPSKRVGLDPF